MAGVSKFIVLELLFFCSVYTVYFRFVLLTNFIVMIKTLITNFTTLRRAEFSIDGLAVLRANSNGGKTSTVNAIIAGVTAEYPPSALRWGESQSVIQLQFPDGMVRLVRTGGSSSYVIDTPTLKQSYSKFGRRLPDEVIDFLNLCIIQVGDESLCLNFHQQFAKPLSLAMSHNRFVSLLSASDLLEEHKRVSKKLSTRAYELQGSIDSFSSLVSTTQNSLDVKASIYKELEPVCGLLDSKYKEVVQLSNALEAVAILSGKLSDLQVKKRQAEFLVQLLDRLSILIQKKVDLEALKIRLDGVNSVRLSVSDLGKKAAYVEVYIRPVLDKLDKLIALSGLVSDLRVKRDSVSLTKESCLKVSELSKVLEIRRARLELLDKVIVSFNEKQDLSVKLQRLSNLRTSVSNLNSLMSEKAKKEIIIVNNLCPLCLSPLGYHNH